MDEGAQRDRETSDQRSDASARPFKHSVLDATSAGAPPTSAVRWLMLAVPLLVMALGIGVLAYGRFHRPAPPPSRQEPSADRRLPAVAPRPSVPLTSSGASRDSAPTMADGSPVSEKWAFDAKDVVARMAAADLNNGRAIFKICAVCHTAEPAGGHRLGPKLWNIVGRRKASYDDYAYSQALRAAGGRWTYEALALYLYDPRAAVPGGKMSFAGIRDPRKLADAIAFMRTLADKPEPLPAAR